MEQVELVETKRVEDGQRRSRALNFGHGHRAVQGHDRRGRQRQQLIVELDNLPPVRGRGARRVAVDGVDGRLQLVRPGTVEAEAFPDQALALRDQLALPDSAVLLAQANQLAAFVCPSWA